MRNPSGLMMDFLSEIACLEAVYKKFRIRKSIDFTDFFANY
jgi:hypothetical protein